MSESKTVTRTESPDELIEPLDADLDTRTAGDLAAYTPDATQMQRAGLAYLGLPTLFLLVTLLGGLRFGAVDSSFIFLKPALIALVFAALTVVLYFGSGLIEGGGWLSERQTLLKNAAGIGILLTLFTATVQLFNALLPEQGLPFWIVGFCFFWTIWNNLFADFDPRRLLRSLVALFGLAFVVKYLLLANLSAEPSGNWLQNIIANPGKEALTYLLDLPRYAAATGYVQFFTLAFYLIGLYILPRRLAAPPSDI